MTPPKRYTSTNSVYVKKAKPNKVVLAREFLGAGRRSKPVLDADTEKTARALFDKIQSAFTKASIHPTISLWGANALGPMQAIV